MKKHFHWKIQPKFISYIYIFFFRIFYGTVRRVYCVCVCTEHGIDFHFAYGLFVVFARRASTHVNFFVCFGRYRWLLCGTDAGCCSLCDSYARICTHSPCYIHIFSEHSDKTKPTRCRCGFYWIFQCLSSLKLMSMLCSSMPHQTYSTRTHVYPVKAIWAGAAVGKGAANTPHTHIRTERARPKTHTHTVDTRSSIQSARCHCIHTIH